MFKCHHCNAGQAHNIKTANKSMENVAEFKYSGMTVRYQNYIHKKIKSKLNFGSVCFHLVQNLLFTIFYLKT